MDNITMNLGPEPLLTINASGDLTVSGWDSPTVEIDVDEPEDNLRSRQGDGEAWFDLKDDASLHVPYGTRLRLARVAGDASVNQVRGTVRIDQVDGDLELRECGAVEVARVRGDFSAKALDAGLSVDSVDGDVALREVGGPVRFARVAGDLAARSVAGGCEADSISGDVSLRDIDGPVKLGMVSGDLSLVDVDGPAQVERVSGDADLQGVLGPVRMEAVAGDLSAVEVEKSLQVSRVDGDAELRMAFEGDMVVQLTAAGDVSCEVEPDSDVTFVLRGDGGVRCQLPGVATTRTNEREVTFKLGEGVAKVMVRASGKVIISPAGAGWPRVGVEFGVEMESFGDELARRIEAEVEQKLRQLDERLGTLSVHFGEHDKASIRRTQERARQQGERARKRAERAAERARRHAGGPSGPSWLPPRPPAPPAPPAPPRPPSEPVRDDERLAILKMVADKKISPAEAEKLLAALEG
jgi:DUF4097 and DUF4098 domain-containing protein YvlB